MAFDDPFTLTAIALAVVSVCIIVVYVMRKREKKTETADNKETEVALRSLAPYRTSPFSVAKTVKSTDAIHAKDELRILDLEREILSDALRRLYEAHADGKISEIERERLAGTYKSRMNNVKEAMAKDETIVALHELESMQEDLVKLFSDRFGELSTKVDELRTKIEIQPIKEVEVQAITTTPSELKLLDKTEAERKQKKRKISRKPSPKSEAEKRIEEIRNEVEKVLDKLGQMEIES